MELARLVDVAGQVRGTPSRLAKQAALARFLRELPPGEVATAVAFLSGETGRGRIGAAHALVHEVRPAPAARSSLTLRAVREAFDTIAATAGPGSTGRRREALGALLALATADEQDFLRRLVLGELRQGALESLMLDAIAQAAGIAPVEVRRAAMYASPGEVALEALTRGADGLARFGLRVFSPVAPMLAQPAESAEAAIGLIGHAALDWKLDGARIQAHKSGGEVRVYTRSLKEVTSRVPEIVAAVAALPAEEIVLDGEAIALDPAGRPHPFQVTMRRFGRKLEPGELQQELPLSPFFFDLLHVDGRTLVSSPATARHAELGRVVPASMRTPRIETSDAAAARDFFLDALARGHEGVMAKAPQSPYEAGSRGANWLKIKQPKTLDLVVLAAEWGSGRRRGWLSNLHLGARDPATGGFVMIGKTFKGLTDATLVWQTAELLARETARDGVTVHVRPELVVEIAFGDVQRSPRYPGGVALRFARVKGYRPDKTAAQADTIDTVRASAPPPAR